MRTDSWAAVTPFDRLAEPLPTRTDCERIARMTRHAYLAATPGMATYQYEQLGVTETELAAALAIAEEPRRHGHIRLRKHLEGDAGGWTVELFGDAIRLDAILGATPAR